MGLPRIIKTLRELFDSKESTDEVRNETATPVDGHDIEIEEVEEAEDQEEQSDEVEESSEEVENEDNEPVPVGELEGIGPTYSERLNNAGIETVEDLIQADIDRVSEEADISTSRLERWRDQAQDFDSEVDEQ